MFGEFFNSLLEMDAIPAGMELFPATNDDSWSLIQRVIQESDYYALVIGGKYGSTTSDGISYTEREYDFAESVGIPVLAFLHENPNNIPAGKSELDAAAREKLAAFRKNVEAERHCKYWRDAEHLGGLVSRSLLQAIKLNPRTGWIRSNEAGGPEALAEINRLRVRIDELQAQLLKIHTEPPKGIENLQQGHDTVPIEVGCYAYDDEDLKAVKSGVSRYRSSFSISIGMTWNELFAVVGPLLFHKSTEHPLIVAIEKKAEELLTNRDAWFSEHGGERVDLSNDDFQTIKVQFIALGLIAKSDRKRAVNDTATYWTLTPYGETVLMRLRALVRKSEGGVQDDEPPSG